tara:strand:+ start:225 stop:494 length:270 start_codon:yes stop_codon:yes gene_type:complete
MENLKEVEQGLWQDEVGNYYEEESILRFRVFCKHPTEEEQDWKLVSSHSTYERAEEYGGLFGERISEVEHYQYKIVDNGEATVVKSLVW